MYHFNLSDGVHHFPCQRLALDWRNEFTLRYELLQRWVRSKSPTATHNPRIGNISFIYEEAALQRYKSTCLPTRTAVPDRRQRRSPPFMLSISVPRGLASKSDPFSGKLLKGGLIEGAPMPAFAAHGLNIGTVTCASISQDGNTLVW